VKNRRKKYLPPSLQEKNLLLLVLTEANAGSDAIGMMKTTANSKVTTTYLTVQSSGLQMGKTLKFYTVLAVTNTGSWSRG
jgi:alkylation response protein AidB-like acyl-CoA dehydrogenase